MAGWERSGGVRVSELVLTVYGRARPQGSVTARPNGSVKYSAALVKWRSTVTETISRLLPGWEPLAGPVAVMAVFVLAGDVTAPPDLDKLVRAIGDALKDARIYLDDAQVVGWYAQKRSAVAGELERVELRIEW